MSIDRREFLKTLGVAGASLSGVSALGKSKPESDSEEFFAILHDITLCEGCQECELACAVANSLPEPSDYPDSEIKRKLKPDQYSVINAVETSIGEVYTKQQCMHCAQPACASACLTKAMAKHVEGPITWDGDKCMGCRFCMLSCPFNMPKFEYDSNNPKIGKCQMCFSRITEGEIPACVENCPAEALIFGKRSEILKEAHRRILDDPSNYVDHVYGEFEAGGTSMLNVSPVPFEELGFNTDIDHKPYPELTKGFLYSVPSVFVLWPALLLGLREATKPEPENNEPEVEE
ncbi:MAG: 4Fe-4S dicluster domain-containing protein [FCB group bacterium]|nr:4Fe-4S dicluster domain-containing protein [FCB group bacterium]MBL7027829.1 4Fe-4S dicluster domain-containing protein [Candidatus Neomarinimicrobiota bacterium]MBL7120910.1 4Fe-4S dicluster domain-containing protein [Candidatus Neomarinimicrobiota bacterium]